MVSVALCTYNGEQYVAEQLISILNQTTLVDEIIVSDDGSIDKTIEVVESIKNTSLIPIYIYKHNMRLGVCANFEYALSLCNGDIIFLSDQDDIWNTHKVETIMKWFDENQSKSVVFTDASLLIDSNKQLKNETLWDCIGFDKTMRKHFDKGLALETFFINRATGATMAIRRDMRFQFSQYCNQNNVYHDYCIALNALNNDSLGYIDQQLISYRIHEQQQAGIKYQISHPKIFKNIYRPICNIPKNFPFKNKTIKNRVLFGYKRIEFTLFQVIFNLFGYIRTYKQAFFHFYLYDIVYNTHIIK